MISLHLCIDVSRTKKRMIRWLFPPLLSLSLCSPCAPVRSCCAALCGARLFMCIDTAESSGVMPDSKCRNAPLFLRELRGRLQVCLVDYEAKQGRVCLVKSLVSPYSSHLFFYLYHVQIGRQGHRDNSHWPDVIAGLPWAANVNNQWVDNTLYASSTLAVGYCAQQVAVVSRPPVANVIASLATHIL